VHPGSFDQTKPRMAKRHAWLSYCAPQGSRLRSPFQAPLSVPGSALRSRIGSRPQDRPSVQDSALKALGSAPGSPGRVPPPSIPVSRSPGARLALWAPGSPLRTLQALGSHSPVSALASRDRRFFRSAGCPFASFPGWLKTIAKRVIPYMTRTLFAIMETAVPAMVCFSACAPC
jgi:hypothetical protein